MNQRAVVSDMPQHERPLSELYRITANAWVDADAKARELEELKTTLLDQRKQMLIDEAAENGTKLADNAAERQARAEPGWATYIRGMVEARTEANRLKVELVRISMREREIADHNANIRADMRMSGR